MDCGAADFIPSADRIRACADLNKSLVHALREFLEFFTDPIHIELESTRSGRRSASSRSRAISTMSTTAGRRRTAAAGMNRSGQDTKS